MPWVDLDVSLALRVSKRDVLCEVENARPKIKTLSVFIVTSKQSGTAMNRLCSLSAAEFFCFRGVSRIRRKMAPQGYINVGIYEKLTAIFAA